MTIIQRNRNTESKRRWARANPDKNRASQKRWQDAHRVEYRAYKRAWEARKRLYEVYLPRALRTIEEECR